MTACGTPSIPSRPRKGSDGDTRFVVRDLKVSFPTDDGPVQAVRGVDLTVNEGELVGVVGESGSGKSVSFLAVMGLLPQSAQITGSAMVRGQELIGVDKKVQRRVRGQRLAIIFQDPLSALNPVHRVGDQIAEMIQADQTSTTSRPAPGRSSCSISSASRSRPPRQAVPTRVLGRHAPAGHDRHGMANDPRC